MIQAFRRDRNEVPNQLFRLRGLTPAAKYEISDLDGGKPQKLTGRQLMESGLALEIPTRPGAAVIFYRKAGSSSVGGLRRTGSVEPFLKTDRRQ